MELINIVLGVVFILIIFTLLSDNKLSTSTPVIKSLTIPNKPIQNNVVESRTKKSPEAPVVKQVSSVSVSPKVSQVTKDIGDFPTPPTTTISSILSPEFVSDVANMDSGKPVGDMFVSEYRSLGNTNSGNIDTSHYPKYYRKDNLSGNTLDTTELRFAGYDDTNSSTSWSDKNVSVYPKYYKSDFEGGLTNVGGFFDQNNQYVDLTGSRTDATIDDVCYTSKSGEKVCLENDKLQNVPPSLVSDSNQCGFLNSIGLLQYSNRVDPKNEKIMNGGFLYGNVRASSAVNETPDVPIKQQSLPCAI